MKLTTGYNKPTFSGVGDDSYLLLAGGGHKAISDFLLSNQNAVSSTKLTTSGGTEFNPVYFSEGKPVATIGRTVPYYTGTGTTATSKTENRDGVSSKYCYPAKWTFNTSIVPTDGVIITIEVPCSGHDYGVMLSVDNGNTYYPVSITNTGGLTTHYALGQIILLIFDSNASTTNLYALSGSTSYSTITGGAWRVVNYYDSGNSGVYLNYCAKTYKVGQTATSAYDLLALDIDGYIVPAHITPFMVGSPMYIYDSSLSANATNSNKNLYDRHYNLTIKNSGSDLSLTIYKPLYLVGDISGNVFIPDSTTPYTQTLPTSEDSRYYLYIGEAYSSTTINYNLNHPIYCYKNGAVRLYGGNADYAVTSNSTINDSDGLPINTTYLKLSGGTLTGTLTVPSLQVTGTTIIDSLTAVNLTVTGASTLTGDVSLGTVKAGTWNGSSIGASYLPTASTSASGIVQLSSATNSTSTTLAATASAVKAAYDIGNHSHPYLFIKGGTLEGRLQLGESDGGNVTVVSGITLLDFTKGDSKVELLKSRAVNWHLTIPFGTDPNYLMSVMHVEGEHSGASWELGGPASSTGNTNLYYRASYNGFWSNWNTLAFTSDIPTSLPANGGSSTYTDFLNAVEPYNEDHKLYFYSGLPVYETQFTTVGRAYPGSFSNYGLYSFPVATDGTIDTTSTYNDGTKVNIMNLRFQWDTKYFHDLFMSPNKEDFWHRHINNGAAGSWKKFLDSGNYSDYAFPITGGTLLGNNLTISVSKSSTSNSTATLTISSSSSSANTNVSRSSTSSILLYSMAVVGDTNGSTSDYIKMSCSSVIPFATNTTSLGSLYNRWSSIYSYYSYSTNGFFQSSDIRLKNVLNYLDLLKSYDFLESCKPFNYEFKSNPGEVLLGISALEVELFYPEIVNTDEDGYKSVQYDKLAVILLEVCKDMNNRLKKLENGTGN